MQSGIGRRTIGHGAPAHSFLCRQRLEAALREEGNPRAQGAGEDREEEDKPEQTDKKEEKKKEDDMSDEEKNQGDRRVFKSNSRRRFKAAGG